LKGLRLQRKARRGARRRARRSRRLCSDRRQKSGQAYIMVLRRM
jgi:hypothetical protein